MSLAPVPPCLSDVFAGKLFRSRQDHTFRRLRTGAHSETAVNGKRSREWTAVARSEVGVVREMARCLRELAAGGWPR